MISGSTAWTDCSDYKTKEDCHNGFMCTWTWTYERPYEHCQEIGRHNRFQDHISSSFVNLEAGVGVGVGVVKEKNIDTFHYHGNDASNEDGFYMYKDEDGDKDEDNDASSDSELDLEDEPNANVSDKKRSYLRAN